MDPLQSLEDENSILARVASALEYFAEQLGDDVLSASEQSEPGAASVRAGQVEELSEFLEAFAALSHNEKEESLLIPALVRAGCDCEAGPVAVARRVHLKQAHLERVLEWAANQTGRWSQAMTCQVQGAVREYASAQVESISNASQSLYPIARQTLPPAALERLRQQMAEFDEEITAESGSIYPQAAQVIETLSSLPLTPPPLSIPS